MKTAYFKKMLVAYAKRFDINSFGCNLIYGFEALHSSYAAKSKNSVDMAILNMAGTSPLQIAIQCLNSHM